MSAFVLNPASLDEALAMLAAHEGARPIAGGATLVAMMNANLIEPPCLVDLQGLADLHGLRFGSEGSVRIGAMTRHRDIAASLQLNGAQALLKRAASVIANRPVRNMGTIGGSLANADPAADYLPALRCLDAEIELASRDGVRRVAMADFVHGWYETALAPGEIVTGVILPRLPEGPTLYRKFARVAGDYATLSCAARLDGAALRVAIGACGPGPIRSEAAEERLCDKLGDERALARFAEELQSLADPVDDVRGAADYRLKLIPRVIRAAALDLLDETAEIGAAHV